MHKSLCKQIDKARRQTKEQEDGDETATTELTAQYNLAHYILELTYLSTDTIDRGKAMYEMALLEFYKLFRQSPFWIGAFESLVLLLALLGYDNYCLALIQLVLHPPGIDDTAIATDADRKEAIRRYTSALSQQAAMDIWICGDVSAAVADDDLSRILIIKKHADYGKIREDWLPKQWCANAVFMPLMIIYMRRQQQESNLQSRETLRLHVMYIAREMERTSQYMAPVLVSLRTDSQQRWGKDEVCSLFACVDYRELGPIDGFVVDPKTAEEDDMAPYQRNAWEDHCYTFWMMIKDYYALTPGLVDTLEETVDAMLARGWTVVPEDPPGTPTSAEHMAWVSYMAQEQAERESHAVHYSQVDRES